MTGSHQPRRSVRYFPSQTDAHPEGHAFLLARDIPLGIMPLRSGREQSSFRVDLKPRDDARAEWLVHFLDVGQYSRHSLDEAVVQFVDTAAMYIGYNGEVYFELLTDQAGEPVQLDPLPPGRILRTPGSYLQVIPKAERQRLGGKRFAAIPRRLIWNVGLPSDLGTPRQHRRLLRRLETLSNPTPGFALQSHDLGRSHGFEFAALRGAYERRQERATRRWGTVMSIQRPVDASTEYFFIARRLAFYQAQARLREHLIAELNKLLEQLGIRHSIEVAGIPTAAEIGWTLDRLHDGTVSFADALDAAHV